MLNNIHSHYIAPYTITSIDCVSDDIMPLTNTFSVGIHPWSTTSIEQNKQSILNRCAELALHPNCIAIGECGLDKLKGGDFNLQLELFHFQLELANKLDKPIIIHCVKAYNELMNIRKQNPSNKWILHGFRGKKELALQLERHDIHLSFGIHLLTSKQVQTAFLAIEKNKFFFETDEESPELIDEIIKCAAQLKNVSLEQLHQQIEHNIKETFRID